MDLGLDYGLDHGLDYGLDHGLNVKLPPLHLLYQKVAVNVVRAKLPVPISHTHTNGK